MRPSEIFKTALKARVYYPELKKPIGSVNAVILFLQILYWQDKTDNDLGVYKTSEEFEDETGLTAKEQSTARKKLREIGLVIETPKRLEHKIYYKVDFDVWDKVLEECAIGISANNEEGFPETPNGNSGNLPKGDSGSNQTANGNKEHLITAYDYKQCNKEKYKKEKKKITTPEFMLGYDLPEQLIQDWLVVRAGKKANSLTQTAFNGVIREANKANLSLEQAITISIERNWIGFKAEWLKANNAHQPTNDMDYVDRQLKEAGLL